MLKYLDMENATFVLNFSELKDYDDFFKKYSSEMINLNIKRLIIRVDSLLIKDINNIIKNNVPTGEMLIIFETKLLNDLDFVLHDNCIIFNDGDIIKNDQVYSRIMLNDDNGITIKNLLEQDINVVINVFPDVNEINKFNGQLESLYELCVGYDINLDGYLVSTDLMKEHPCNSYLCNGDRCHKKVSGLPKNILINNDWNMYPHGLCEEGLLIGNLYDKESITSVLEDYMNLQNYKLFIDLNKSVFIKYVRNYPFQFFPLTEFIKKEYDSHE